jgi:hypothetical protein
VDIAHAVLRARRDLVDLLVDLPQLQADLVEDREAVVVEIVEQFVEEPARAAREEIAPKLFVRVAALEEPCDRLELDRRQRDEVVGPDEDVELARVEAAL